MRVFTEEGDQYLEVDGDVYRIQTRFSGYGDENKLVLMTKEGGVMAGNGDEGILGRMEENERRLTKLERLWSQSLEEVVDILSGVLIPYGRDYEFPHDEILASFKKALEKHGEDL